jgi:branched-chain amino acid transport system permease protein
MATPTQASTDVTPARSRRRQPSLISTLGLLLVALLVVWLAINLVREPADFVEISLIGLTTGCLYALIALGYTLVYGILELINFAHGDVFMLGGMISATFVISVFSLSGTSRGVGTWLLVVATLLIAMGACGLPTRRSRRSPTGRCGRPRGSRR